MAQATIKNVAERAGVSKATVSRVLNNHPYVADDIRARVQQAMLELGYQPNRAARRLRAKSSDILGLIIPDIQNPLFQSVVRGIEDAAYAQQMNVVLCNTDDIPQKQMVYLRVMQAERAAGVLVVPTLSSDGDVLRPVQEAGTPIVLLDRDVDQFEADLVRTDNVHGAYAAVWHLAALGYKRIAIIAGSQYLTPGHERLRGYQNALEKAGLALDRTLIREGNFRVESGYTLARDLVTALNPPDAIFVSNNLMTLGALRALHELGIRIPEDVALVGFDDMPWAGDLYPPLTTVAQSGYELGQIAVELLLRRIAQPALPFRRVILQPQLVVRRSCGALARQAR